MSESFDIQNKLLSLYQQKNKTMKKNIYMSTACTDFGSNLGTILLLDIDTQIIKVNTITGGNVSADEIINMQDVLNNFKRNHFEYSDYKLVIYFFDTELEMLKSVSYDIGDNQVIEWSVDQLKSLKRKASRFDFFDFELKDDAISASDILNNGIDIAEPGFKTLTKFASEKYNIILTQSEYLKKMGLTVNMLDVTAYGFEDISNDPAHVLIRTILGSVVGTELYKEKTCQTINKK